MTPPFHLAYPVTDLDEARMFFTEKLGATVGRSAERWVDLNLFGHQISLHLIDGQDLNSATNTVDGDQVPTLHFGCVLDWTTWENNYAVLTERQAEFIIDKKIRFKDEIGEQGTYFVKGPCGIAIEFKSFKDPSQLFAAN